MGGKKDYRNYGKTFRKPKRPFEKERLDGEMKIIGEYGLKNKREVWRVQYALAKIRAAARTLLTLDEKSEQRMFAGEALLRRMVRLGLLLESERKLDYVLGLTVSKIMERRLQTQVFKLGLAKSVHHARTLIRQRHIRVGKQICDIPSFLVRLDSQKHIDFALTSPFGGGRPGRVRRKRLAGGGGKEGGDDDDDCKISLQGLRIVFAEFIGTFILTVIGIGTTISENPLGPLAGGIGVMLGIYYAANASGGHVNPAVTAGFWIQGRLADSFLRGTLLMAIYWASQIGGAFFGAATAHAIYVDELQPIIDDDDLKTVCKFATCPANMYIEPPTINQGSMFFDQVIGTFILVSTVMALTDPRNANPPGLAPLFIGLSATAVGVAYGGNAGGAINPARDFGPRLWASFFDGESAFSGVEGTNSEYFFWIPLAGPLAGGLLAGVCYVIFIMAHWPDESDKSNSAVSPRSSTTSSIRKSAKHNPYADEEL